MSKSVNRALGSMANIAIRRAWIVLAVWVALAAGLTVAVPKLEKVVSAQSGPFIPDTAPSLQTIKRMGEQFGESTSTAIGYVVFEDDGGFNDADRRYYDSIIRALGADHVAIDSVQDLIGDPATASIGASRDGKAVYSFVRFHGGMGSAAQLRGQTYVQSVLDSSPAPAGLHTYLTGPAPTIGEELKNEDRVVLIITLLSVVMIVFLLLAVYRSLITIVVPLATVGLALAVARAIVSGLAVHFGLEVSIFSVMLLAALILGGGTDYAIFLISSYHEHRRRNLSPHDSIVAAVSGTGGVIVASGLTVAASCAVMSLTHIVLFRTVGIPCSIGVLVAMLAAITLVPALMSILSRRGFIEPRPSRQSEFWRRLGVLVVRRPRLALAASTLIVGVLAVQVLWISTGYNEQAMQAKTTSANRGYDAIARHYDPNELTADYVLIESDHDLRNGNDFSALNVIARAVAALPGVKAVRGPTQPEGAAVPEFTLSFQAGALADKLTEAIAGLTANQPQLARLQAGVERLDSGMGQIRTGVGLATGGSARIARGGDDLRRGLRTAADGADQLSTGSTAAAGGARELADGIAGNVDPILQLLDQFAPPQLPEACAHDSGCPPDAQLDALSHDTSIPGKIRFLLTKLKLGAAQLADGNRRLAAGATQLHDGITAAANGSNSLADGQALLTSKLGELSAGTSAAKSGIQQLSDGIAQIAPQTQTLIDGLTQARNLLKDASGAAANPSDAGFYVPKQAFADPRMAVAMHYFLSRDGHSARFVVLGDSTAFSGRAIDRVNATVREMDSALRFTTLRGASVHATGLAAGLGDLQAMVDHDFIIIAIAALALIFLILAVLVGGLVAPLYMIATIVVSYVAALGICKLVWQDLLGIDVYWAVPPLAFVALVAVGSDYNLLFMARIREESTLGLRSGIIKAFTATGGVISTAGVIFALTMLALLASPTQNISQVGFAIGAGILLDTFVVRAVTVPAIAALLGSKNWWPQKA